MPNFICPLTNCRYYDNITHDCSRNHVKVKPRSNAFDMTIECISYDTSLVFKCGKCDKELTSATEYCHDCWPELAAEHNEIIKR